MDASESPLPRIAKSLRGPVQEDRKKRRAAKTALDGLQGVLTITTKRRNLDTSPA
jgi:hypothetical protein